MPDSEHALRPLLDNGFSDDLVKRISDPRDRWTHYYAGNRSYHQLDYILALPRWRQRTTVLFRGSSGTGHPLEPKVQWEQMA